jgi:hypothetical protein
LLRRAVILGAVGAVCAASAVSVSSALAAPPTPSHPAGKELGVVPARGKAGKLGTSQNLTYHNGPVMHTNKVYAIYWVPPGYTVDSGYESLINRYFGDVAAANGQTSNVYYSDTQYYDTTGSIAYASSFAGSYVDTSPLPASGCKDSYTSVCVTDAQLQSEITRVIKANGWTPNSSTEFFMFTAKGIGSCDGSSSCAFSQYCAYHSWIGSGSTATVYANMPYADTVPAACDAGQHPNNDDADATINVTSHEHNESITDEQGSAWFDRRGYEDGDKCAWNFGTALGSDGYGQYNQVINGHDYYLQQEWSNHSSGCVLQGI